MGVHDALGQARGATRGSEPDHIVRIDGDTWIGRRLLRDELLQRFGPLHFAIYADPLTDLRQLRPQGSNGLGKFALEEQDLAVERVQYVAVLLGRIARAHRNPAQVGAPQTQGT
ncbi:hypothetical protein D9M70_443080 [compost metagenome]